MVRAEEVETWLYSAPFVKNFFILYWSIGYSNGIAGPILKTELRALADGSAGGYNKKTRIKDN